MASRKSQVTKDREASQLALVQAQLADTEQLRAFAHAELRKCAEELSAEKAAHADTYETLQKSKAEILRIQALLRITQVKLAQHDRRQRVDGTPRGPSFRERCKAYFAATGERSVTAPELIAWENSHA